MLVFSPVAILLLATSSEVPTLSTTSSVRGISVITYTSHGCLEVGQDDRQGFYKDLHTPELQDPFESLVPQKVLMEAKERPDAGVVECGILDPAAVDGSNVSFVCSQQALCSRTTNATSW